MPDNSLVPPSTLTHIVPVAVIYGGYNLWMLTIKKKPPRMCDLLRYLLGYWVGSTIYIVMCIIFPLLLATGLSAAYYKPEWFDKLAQLI